MSECDSYSSITGLDQATRAPLTFYVSLHGNRATAIENRPNFQQEITASAKNN